MYFLHYFLFITLSFYVISCGKKEASLPPTNVNTTHTVKVSKTSIIADDFDESMIAVYDKNGNDVTAQSSITVNGTVITDLKYRTKVAGTVNVIAKLQNENSPVVTISATNPGPSKYTQKVLLEKYTGAWCGNCPRVAYKVKQTTTANNRIIPVYIHDGDALHFSLVNALKSNFNITGVPSVYINRTLPWTDNQSNWNETVTEAANLTANWAPLGLSIQSNISGNTISGTVKTEFNVNTSRALKIVIMLVEDGVVLSQSNYYNATAGSPLQGLGQLITNYSHNNVLRQFSTDLLGDAIPANQVFKNNIYDKAFSFNVPGVDINKCYIVASVLYDNHPTWKGSLNTQIVKAGQAQNFD
jgi:hypothetical protein